MLRSIGPFPCFPKIGFKRKNIFCDVKKIFFWKSSIVVGYGKFRSKIDISDLTPFSIMTFRREILYCRNSFSFPACVYLKLVKQQENGWLRARFEEIVNFLSYFHLISFIGRYRYPIQSPLMDVSWVEKSLGRKRHMGWLWITW